MFLHPIDWAIIIVYLVGCVVAGVWMKRYVRGVEDFAIAGREMDINLGVASLAATEVGIVTIMYTAQMGFTNGLAGATPGVLIALAMFLVGLTGFVIVPMRNAGVITIPELFENRFGKRVRWLAGLVIILGGVLNMGIFLRVGGEFLMYVTGFDPQNELLVTVMGHELRLGYLEMMMTSLLAIILLYTALGGMVSVLITDYLQFLVMGLGIVIVSVLVVANTGWVDLRTGLADAHRGGQQFRKEAKSKEEQSRAEVEVARNALGQQAAEAIQDRQSREHQAWLKANARPLAQRGVLVSEKKGEAVKAMTMDDPFNPVLSKGWAWVIWQALTAIAVVTTWQTIIARVLAARDSQTAKRVYRRTSFYFVGRFALPGLWGAAAFLYFAAQPGGLPEGLDSLTAMPAFLKTLLPVGLIGIVVAAMLAAEMSTDSGYLLTWATVIYNDLINPCLRKPMSPKAKLRTVRLLVLAIGLFLVFYGLWYELPGGAWDYLAITGNIYLASLFTLLVGALYWRGANSWGAIAAIVLGATGPLAYLVVNALVDKLQLDPSWKIEAETSGFAAFGLSFAGMYFGSLLGRMFGRGQAPAPTAGSNIRKSNK